MSHLQDRFPSAPAPPRDFKINPERGPDAARRYADAGFRVMPGKANDHKEPALGGFGAAFPDFNLPPDSFATANPVLILTGACPALAPDDLAVLDLDGDLTIAQVEAALGVPLAPTLSSKGGRHLFYRVPPSDAREQLRQWNFRPAGLELDLKWRGGYVLERGDWDGSGFDPSRIAIMPPELVQALCALRARFPHAAPTAAEPGAFSNPALDGMCDLVPCDAARAELIAMTRRLWPAKGERHFASLAWGGACAYAGIDYEWACSTLATALEGITGNVGHHLKNVAASYSCEAPAGRHALASYFKHEAPREWFGLVKYCGADMGVMAFREYQAEIREVLARYASGFRPDAPGTLTVAEVDGILAQTIKSRTTSAKRLAFFTRLKSVLAGKPPATPEALEQFGSELAEALPGIPWAWFDAHGVQLARPAYWVVFNPPEPTPEDPPAATVEGRDTLPGEIVRFKSQLWIRGKDGEYLPRALTPGELDAALHAHAGSIGVRSELDMPKKKRDLDVFTDVAMAVDQNYMTRATEWDPKTRTLTLRVLDWAPLAPVFHQHVADWLLAFAGADHIEALKQWLAAATSLDRPVPALMPHGPLQTGKSLLGCGLVRIWNQRAPVGLAEALCEAFNAGLLRCPVAMGDEGFPEDLDFNEFKERVPQREHQVNEKYVAKVPVVGCVRYVIASNWENLLRYQKIGSSGANNLEAIADRLLVIPVQKAAAAYLRSLPEGTIKAMAERQIAEHVLWLADNVQLQPETERWAAKPGGAEILLREIIAHRHAAALTVMGEALAAAPGTNGVWDDGTDILVNVKALALRLPVVAGVKQDGREREVRDLCAAFSPKTGKPSVRKRPPRAGKETNPINWRRLDRDGVLATLAALDLDAPVDDQDAGDDTEADAAA